MPDSRCPIRAFLVVGQSSDSGKTVVTLGLARRFRDLGLRVACAKLGPDLLDASTLSVLEPSPVHTLDPTLQGLGNTIAQLDMLVAAYDVVLVEGAGGLVHFDNHRHTRTVTGFAAAEFGLGVVVVVSDSTWDPSEELLGVRIAAVVWNMVEPNTTAWSEAGQFPSASLPRLVAENRDSVLEFAVQASKALDPICKAIWAQLPESHSHHDFERVPVRSTSRHRISVGMAIDEAFCFYYRDTLEFLRDTAKSVRSISPIGDEGIPDDIDFVILGDGPIEEYTHLLARNRRFISSIHSWVQKGRGILCWGAGAVYLGESLVLADGRVAGLAGVLPTSAVLRTEFVGPTYVAVSAAASKTSTCLESVHAPLFKRFDITSKAPPDSWAYCVVGMDSSLHPDGSVYGSVVCSEFGWYLPTQWQLLESILPST